MIKLLSSWWVFDAYSYSCALEPCDDLGTKEDYALNTKLHGLLVRVMNVYRYLNLLYEFLI